MNKNTGANYELLTQQLYQKLLDYEHGQYKKITVQHDIQIVGKTSIKHQVDAYWEFELAGVHYKTIIEVKEWKSKVKKEQVMGFKAKIDDISGFPTGIFVSKSGFQRGAIEYARVHGIKLVSIDETHKMNHLVMRCCSYSPHIEHFEIMADQKWVEKKKVEHGIYGEIAMPCYSADAILCDDNGYEKPLINFIREALNPYFDKPGKEINHVAYAFEEPWYLLTRDKRLQKMLIRSFEFDLSFAENVKTMEFHPDEAVDYILRDIIDGTQIAFNSVHGIIHSDT
jgi:hypothetical protein